MNTYSIKVEASPKGTLLRIAFGDPAQNDQIVKDATAALETLSLEGGETVLINGPASLPVAMVIAHGVCHLFKEVACFDPKMGSYVVAISHGGRPVGSLI